MRTALGHAVVAVLAACGGSDDDVEIVVADATLGGATPVVLGATGTAVTWSSSSGTTTIVGGATLATLPASAQQLVIASGQVAAAGDFVAFENERSIARVGLDGVVLRLTTGEPEALAGGAGDPPVVAWTAGPVVSWGADTLQQTAMLTKIDRCDHARVTTKHVHVACDGTSGRRLFRIEHKTGEITGGTHSDTWAASFPGGPMVGATYKGRIAAADDAGVLWLIEELPSRRGIVLAQRADAAEPVVILEHVREGAGFFLSADTVYWQERDALLSAPRAGGAASIAAALPGAAGAFADGFVYYTHGTAIERLRVE